jgi:hypothetical protein
MNGVFRAIQFAWQFAAFFLLASVVAAPFVALWQRCRARSQRLFVDQPNEVLRQLHPDTRIDHRWDA